MFLFFTYLSFALPIGTNSDMDYSYRLGLLTATSNYTSSLSYNLLTNITLMDGDYSLFDEVLKSFGRAFDVIFLLESRLTKQQIQGS